MLTTLTQQPGFREQACCRRTENFHLKAPGPKIEDVAEPYRSDDVTPACKS
jgi:hypothetical protein